MNLIVANEITPHLTAEEYMDKGEYENEIKQVRDHYWCLFRFICIFVSIAED